MPGCTGGRGELAGAQLGERRASFFIQDLMVGERLLSFKGQCSWQVGYGGRGKITLASLSTSRAHSTAFGAFSCFQTAALAGDVFDGVPHGC